jgi:hypothetical protein
VSNKKKGNNIKRNKKPQGVRKKRNELKNDKGDEKETKEVNGKDNKARGVDKGVARILLAHPKIKVKHIENKIHLQYLSIICLWFKIWPTPAKNHCYALGRGLGRKMGLRKRRQRKCTKD